MEKANTPAAVAAQLEKAAADTETIAAALSLMVCKQKPPTKIQTQAQDFAAAYPEKRTIHETAAAHHRREAEAADNLARLYDRLWREADGWACENLTGEDLDAYYAFTD